MGAFAVGNRDQHWDGPRVGSRRARLLLALLAVENGRLISMDRVVHTLWPDAAPRHPVANVATLVSRLRAKFDSHLIVGGRSGYRIGERVGSDLNAAADLVASADAGLAARDFPAARSAADQALDLLRGEILPAFDEESWVVAARAQRLRLQQRARHASAEAALQTGEPWDAVATADTAIAAEPYDETAYRTMMRAFESVGEPAQALLAYERLRLTLASNLGVDPAASTRATYLAILRR